MASRNRPRSSFAKDDSGEAELQNLWGTIVDKMRRCQTLRAKFDAAELRKQEIEDEMKAETLSIGQAWQFVGSLTKYIQAAKASAAKLDELEKLHREGLRLSEEEVAILNEEPEDLIRNLDTLIQVKTALDIDVAKPTLNTKRNNKRKLDPDATADSPVLTPETTTPSQSLPRALSKGVSRSGSVAAASVKSENSGEIETVKCKLHITRTAYRYEADTTLLAVAGGKESKLVVGAEVLHRKKGSDGVGILCRVTKIIGEGKGRRYEVQDVEADDDTSVERVAPQNLVPVPEQDEVLPEIAKGTQVVAVYPDTTTFYKAQVVGMKKDGMKYRLRFEGEEEKNKEQEVFRYLVLDKS